MTLAFLQIENLRNIQSARVQLHPHLNIISGLNGSGKTSFLEAIYLLGAGHSFRTREVNPLIAHNYDQLTVFSRTFDQQTLSIQKSRSLPTQVRINSVPCKSSSELAYFLPCQVFYQDIFQIIDAGPSVRRSLLDWGLFHVEPRFFPLWKDYTRALKQRNALLRQKASAKSFEPWNLILSETGSQLDQFRLDYFSRLHCKFKEILSLLTDIEPELGYYRGWDRKNTGKSLYAILSESLAVDLTRQYTQYGAHQADIHILSDDHKVKHSLSRGQQKIILFALKIAQAQMLSKPCVYLCDDLTSELDQNHIKRLFSLINSIDGQFFISLINSDHVDGFVDKSKVSFLSVDNGTILARD